MAHGIECHLKKNNRYQKDRPWPRFELEVFTGTKPEPIFAPEPVIEEQ